MLRVLIWQMANGPARERVIIVVFVVIVVIMVAGENRG
jgi:hypothetical protein